MTTATKQPQEILLKNPSAKTYAYEQVLESSISYFNGDELAATTWMNKYAMKDTDGKFVEQSPDDMHKRMAKEFGRIEADYKLKYNLNGELSSIAQIHSSFFNQGEYKCDLHPRCNADYSKVAVDFCSQDRRKIAVFTI